MVVDQKGTIEVTKIFINIEADDAGEAREQMARLLNVGFVSLSNSVGQTSDTAGEVDRSDDNSADVTETAAEAPQRERGKPSPGRARRTKEEIAEDEAADKADADLAAANEETGAVVADRQISTNPENRIDPEDAARDEADEKAETAATSGKKLTHDDVRNALGAYVKAYGMAAAQADGPVLIGKVLGDETKTKVSDLPDDQEVLAKAVAGVQEMISKNPFGRAADL